MGYPVGVQLSTLTFSNPITFLGNEATRTEVTVQATAGVVWAATGQPIDDFTELVAPGSGMPGSLTVPFVDQPGFTDQAGNEFTMWAYVVTRTTYYGNASKTVKKNWQPLVGQTTVDFDNLPGGSIGLPVAVPPNPVSSVAGLTGMVAAESLLTALEPELSATYAQTDAGNSTNLRGLSADVPTFDNSFTFEKISSNQDGWLVVKDLNVTGGFGGQVGQGGPISYFKAIGIAAHHSGQGNYDHFWGSLYHDGTREAGMFIGDITARRGGNAYGGHFRVTSQTTAPPFLVGLSLEVVPNVAKGVQSTATLATTIPAATATTSVELTAPLLLTSGTNLEFTAADTTKVVAYVSTTMGAASTTIPVTSFTTNSVINSGGTVTVGVNSTYLGLLVEQNGSETASAAISITGPGSATTPYNFGLNFDSTAASSTATAIMVGGSWGSGINMNANSITSVGSITATGSSPNRDVRLVDNLMLDNARHIKFKDAGGTARKIVGVTSSDNTRFIAAGASKQWEFYDSTEATMVARVTGSGRADFSTAGVTTKYTSGATQPAYLTNGQVEVWHDTGSGTSYLVVNVNGTSKKVALA